MNIKQIAYPKIFPLNLVHLIPPLNKKAVAPQKKLLTEPFAIQRP